MTEIKEIQIQTIGEPAQVKVSRGMKGEYAFEVNLHSDKSLQATADMVIDVVTKLNVAYPQGVGKEAKV